MRRRRSPPAERPPRRRPQFKVPAALGYGAVGSPPVIPKNATLILAVELLSVG
ncbi:FKBP-type peptidyl-prolyl cis-trans isomerase [Candidatus Latescibacterota bacterium]